MKQTPISSPWKKSIARFPHISSHWSTWIPMYIPFHEITSEAVNYLTMKLMTFPLHNLQLHYTVDSEYWVRYCRYRHNKVFRVPLLSKWMYEQCLYLHDTVNVIEWQKERKIKLHFILVNKLQGFHDTMYILCRTTSRTSWYKDARLTRTGCLIKRYALSARAQHAQWTYLFHRFVRN